MNWNQELFVRSLLRHREGANMLGAHNTVPLFVDCCQEQSRSLSAQKPAAREE